MKFLPAVFSVAALVFLFACTDDDVSPVVPPSAPVASRLALQDQLRQLGSERVFWMRVFIIDSVGGLPDKDVTLNRLMKNQVELGNAFKPYYGDAMGVQLTSLLEEQVRQTVDLIATIPTGSTAPAANLVDPWREQANLIADFLATSNPSLNRDELRAAFQLQNDATLAQIAARLGEDWTGDILAYDTAAERGIVIADTITTATATQYPDKVMAPSESAGEQDFHEQQRRLWQDHDSWERFVIISKVSGLADLEATTARLLRNQRELGDSFKPVIGDAAGNQLTRMLEDHVTGMLSVLDSGTAENETGAGAARAVWLANADQIAAFLAASIPTLDPAQMQVDMRDHLENTGTQAAHRVAGQYQAEIDAFDVGLGHSLEFADTLTAGAATQNGAQSVPPT